MITKEIQPLEEEVTATCGKFQVTLLHLDEGLDGDYNPENPKDIPLLRMDITYRANDSEEWEVVKNGSFCTQIDARITPERALQIAQAAANLLAPFKEPPSHIELLSWAKGLHDIQTKFEVKKAEGYCYIEQTPPPKINEQYPCLRISAPHLLKNTEFTEWLKTSTEQKNQSGVATWHRPGNEPGEYSDIFLWKDANYEGSDSDMPEEVWKELCDTAGTEFIGILWIDFLQA